MQLTKPVKRQVAEQCILAGVKRELLRPKFQAAFAKEPHDILNAQQNGAPALREQLRQIDGKLKKTAELLSAGMQNLVGALGQVLGLHDGSEEDAVH